VNDATNMKSGAATGLVQRLAALLRTRERQFWFLQTLGWGTFFVAAYLGALAAEKPVSYNQLIIVAAASGYVLSLVLRYVYRLLWQRSPTVFITSAVLLSYLMGLVWTLLKNLVFWEVYRPDYWPDNLMSYFSGAFGSTYVFLCWSGLYFGIKYYLQLQEQTQQTLKATSAAHQAQLWLCSRRVTRCVKSARCGQHNRSDAYRPDRSS